jgi:hypothetical protein
MPLFLKGEKEMSWVLVTQKMKGAIFAERRPLCKGTTVSLKNDFKRKEFSDIDPSKEIEQ